MGKTPFLAILLGIWPKIALGELGEDRLYRSAGLLGRGDAGISSADDEDAIFYNPAGLALGKGIYKKTVLLSPQIEISSNTRDLIRRISLEKADAIDTALDQIGKPNHASYQNFTGIVLRRAALGAFASGSLNVLAHKEGLKHRDGYLPAECHYILKNSKYVGALSKNDDRKPVNQKYIILLWLPSKF